MGLQQVNKNLVRTDDRPYTLSSRVGGQHILSVKGQTVNILDFVGH